MRRGRSLASVGGAQLRFPSPARLRVGDRFVFLPTVEIAVAWLRAPANAAVCERLSEPLELLLAALESRSPMDLSASYRALLVGIAREGLVFR